MTPETVDVHYQLGLPDFSCNYWNDAESVLDEQ